jgi:hypothetical protein
MVVAEVPDAFFVLELGGTVFLFLGFLFSARYIGRREAARPVTAPSTPAR